MALQSQRAMLDALMGNERNELPNAPKSRIKWNDRDVCPYFLCGFCPHALFPSTKNDLGPCSYHHHEDYLRDAYDVFIFYLVSVDFRRSRHPCSTNTRQNF